MVLRVELNAFTAPALIDYVTRQLADKGVRGKVIPPADVIAREARDVYEEALDALVDQVVSELIPIDRIKRALAMQFRERLPWPKTRDWVETSLEENPTHSWHRALKRKVRKAVERFADEATTAIQARVRTALDDEPSPGSTDEEERC